MDKKRSTARVIELSLGRDERKAKKEALSWKVSEIMERVKDRRFSLCFGGLEAFLLHSLVCLAGRQPAAALLCPETLETIRSFRQGMIGIYMMMGLTEEEAKLWDKMQDSGEAVFKV